jgi:hypothetical protein
MLRGGSAVGTAAVAPAVFLVGGGREQGASCLRLGVGLVMV